MPDPTTERQLRRLFTVHRPPVAGRAIIERKDQAEPRPPKERK